MRGDNGTEGPTAGTVSDNGLDEFRTVSFGGAASETTLGAGLTDSELFTAPGNSGGRDTGSSSVDPTPKKRRGRPPGAAKSTATKPVTTALSAERMDAARRKFTGALAGGVGFGFSYYGINRAKKYKQISPLLAQRIYQCYQIPMPAAESIAEPIADTFIAWFPQYVEPATKGVDPVLAIARLISVLQQTSDNEKATVAQFYQEQNSVNNSHTNGHTPPPETMPADDEKTEWNNHQSAEEILTANV